MARTLWQTALTSAATLGVLAALGGGLDAATRARPCASTEITASVSAPAAAVGQAGPDRLTIVLAGDTGFNATDALVAADGVHKDRQVIGFAEMLAGVVRDIDGDLAFANLETVVTDRNDLPPDSKGQTAPFHFRSHPQALKALIDAGFNLISLANNHSMDYGAKGLDETLYHLAVAAGARAIAYAGIGINLEEATRPGCLELDGTRIAFAATGIVTGQRLEHRAGPDKPGQVEYRQRPDFETVVNRLAGFAADYRILSIHYGLEGRVVPDERQITDWREFAAREKGIDLIVGHHPHVAQGVELDGSSLIFYGLGNFLHPGTAEMSRFGLCRDYGLMAKVHLARAEGAWRVEAIEAIPLTNTQIQPRRFSPEESQRRIYALNHLAAGLDDGKGARGVRFTPQSDGSGLYCAEGAATLGGKLAALCSDWQPPPPPPGALAARLAKACQDKPFYGKPSITVRNKPSSYGGFRPF